SSVTAVSSSGNTQFDLAFPSLGAGSYTLTVGPDILDAATGLQMDQNANGTPGEIPGDQFVSTFTVIANITYRALDVPINFVELAADPAAFTIIASGADSAAAVNLGTNTFRFYNGAYTGSNQLFASTNALLTFGSANTAFTNADLTTAPTQAAIAVFWDD